MTKTKIKKLRKEFEKKFPIGSLIWHKGWEKDDSPVIFNGWDNEVSLFAKIYFAFCTKDDCDCGGISNWIYFTEAPKKTQIKYFWGNMPPWAKYVAMDDSGEWFYFTSKPTLVNGKSWTLITFDENESEGYIVKKYAPTWYKGSFKNSLMERK